MVRDGKTGKVITAPEPEHLWTWREKHGLGRSSKSEWTNRLEVGPLYFLKVELLRKFYLNFDDYYEVWLWDFVPGATPFKIYSVIVEVRCQGRGLGRRLTASRSFEKRAV